MQDSFNFGEEHLREEVVRWENSGTEKGQIYTQPRVVEFMLTALGLNEEFELDNIRILEPSCGEGEFVVAIAERLIQSSKIRPSIAQLMNKVLAVDLVGKSISIARMKVLNLMLEYGYMKQDIHELLDNWFLTSDFLLEDIKADFTHVVGNPPYVRVESIPKILLTAYRRQFSTMTDRADLYIPFYEKSLSLLKDNGTLSFICTDRWTKNTYGKSLRQFISNNYSLELFIDLYGIDAFESSVMTYPAITQIRKGKVHETALLHETTFTDIEAQDIRDAINNKKSMIQMRKNIVNGSRPWLLGSSDQIALIKKLEKEFPLLEDAGCKIYIGAATGANKIYVVSKESVEIEDSRLLPVITASELKSGSIQWQGKHIINTYDESGVVCLKTYPKLASYLISHKEALSKRHVAKKDSSKWFKTIDRVYEERSKSEKLLIPDISSEPVVIYDQGQYHPNNSIYYICSSTWNLHALRVVLLSDITKMFISIYSTKIAHGYLRFQAQHLRKLRVPQWNSIDPTLRQEMIDAGKLNDTANFTKLTCKMYKLNKNELSVVGS
jgi:methylase of polypeptide subunit release factors